MTCQNRRWNLDRHPDGSYDESVFRRDDTDLNTGSAPLEPGEVVARWSVFLCAPAMKLWMDAEPHGKHPHMEVGAPVFAPAAGRVIASAHEGYPVGTRLQTRGSWQDVERFRPDYRAVRVLQDGDTLVDYMGPLGLNALTAYFGTTEVGRPGAGDTFVVSGAAGSTGSTAAQIGKHLGARVVGIAGGARKCDFLVDELGLDAAVDYRAGDLADQLRTAAPDGIDVFYDNVGGQILDAVLDQMNRGGRVALCGQISGYNDGGLVAGPSNMMRVIYGSLTLQGFLVSDYEDSVLAARDELRSMIEQGAVRPRVDVHASFDELPAALGKVYDGSNQGTTLVVVDEDAYSRD